jgi:hypothetical protein
MNGKRLCTTSECLPEDMAEVFRSKPNQLGLFEQWNRKNHIDQVE